MNEGGPCGHIWPAYRLENMRPIEDIVQESHNELCANAFRGHRLVQKYRQEDEDAEFRKKSDEFSKAKRTFEDAEPFSSEESEAYEHLKSLCPSGALGAFGIWHEKQKSRIHKSLIHNEQIESSHKAFIEMKKEREEEVLKWLPKDWPSQSKEKKPDSILNQILKGLRPIGEE